MRTLRFRFQSLMKLFLAALKEFASLHSQVLSRSNKLYQKQADMGKSGYTAVLISKTSTASGTDEQQVPEKDQEAGLVTEATAAASADAEAKKPAAEGGGGMGDTKQELVRKWLISKNWKKAGSDSNANLTKDKAFKLTILKELIPKK